MQLSVKEMGPSLLSRLLNLTDTQDGVLAIVFQLARDFDLPLVVLEDLRVILLWMAAHGDVITLRYGAFTVQTIGGIQRQLNALDYEGLGEVFGATRLDLRDLIHRDEASIGRVNILSANRLIQSPRLYGAVLTWLLQTLYRQLPEIGDVDRPRLVLFFDEAHLLFKDSPKLLCDEIERMVRLIRSKGVGVFFVTQSPGDLPAPVLGQLGNRVLHALRGYTPRDLKAIRSVAETFRSNPEFDTQAAIVDLQIGEALVSTLGCSGEPSVVQKILIRPPSTQIGTIDAETRAKIIAASPLDRVYTRGPKPISDRDATAQRLDAAFGIVAMPTDPLPAEFPKTSAAPLPALIPDHPARRLYRRVHAKLEGARLVAWVEAHSAGLGRRLVRLVLKRRGPTPE